MDKKLWLLCGPLAAGLYVLTVIAGAILHPGERPGRCQFLRRRTLQKSIC